MARVGSRTSTDLPPRATHKPHLPTARHVDRPETRYRKPALSSLPGPTPTSCTTEKWTRWSTTTTATPTSYCRSPLLQMPVRHQRHLQLGLRVPRVAAD